LTGEGGDILIVDDPHKPATICSKLQREKVADWFCNTLLSRLDDRKTGAIIIVMQRLHEEDLTGVLLEKNGASWKVLVLKAIATEDEKFRKRGEVIHSERDSLEEMIELKGEMGDLQFETQYQQEPRMQGRGLIKEESVIIEEVETDVRDDYCVFSVDSASKIGLSADFTAITIWGVRKEKLYLRDCYKVKFEFGELLRFIKFLLVRFNPSFVLIEDKASGIALIQELKRVNFGGKVVDIRVKYDKVVRFLSCLPLFEAGKVIINGKIPILKEIKEELLNFPFVRHDDIVDSISQFLNWYLKRWQGEAFAGVRVRRL
jgi:predicted phage terminase large subunit-like protein